MLFHRKLFETFKQFLDDLIVTGGTRLIRLSTQDMEIIPTVAQQFGLDFDDAYQYVLADKYDLEIVSFDSDFDRTKKGRKTPNEILIQVR